MKYLLTFLAGALILGSGILVGFNHQPASQSFGNFNPTGGGTYYLQSSINSTQTTIALSSFTEPGTNIPYTMTYLNSSIEFATINPIGAGNPTGNKSEFVSFTGITQNSNGTALLTGVTRGLSRSYPYTASSTQAYSAPGQTQFILSSPPQFYNQYANLSNSQVITGQWQFTTLPTSSVACTSGTQFCNKAYIDAGLNQGAATSTFANLGLVWLASSAQVGLSTASSTTGAPLVIPNAFATTTPTATCNTWHCIVAATSGKISQAWLDLTQAFTFTNNVTILGTTTMATSTMASSTISNTLNVNNLNVLGTFAGQVVNYQDFTSSGTWTKPSGLSGNSLAYVIVWGGGGGGGGSLSAGAQTRPGGGGGGGSCVQAQFPLSVLGSTVTVTIGNGGTGGLANTDTSNGSVGGDTTFGTVITAYGGGGGAGGTSNPATGAGGGGAGIYADGSAGSGTTPGTGSAPLGGAGSTASTYGGGGGSASVGGASVYGGGGGGGGTGNSGTGNLGGMSLCGGGGGDGGSSAASAGAVGSVSIMGGGGGIPGFSSTAGGTGTQPAGGGGGGGGSSSNTNFSAGGVGGKGEVRVYIIK